MLVLGLVFLVTLISVNDTTAQCVQPPSGLVSWWPRDGNANDIAGGNNGTLQNGLTFAVGQVSLAFSYDGFDDQVEILDDPSLSFGSGNFSIDAWIKTTLSEGAGTIVSKQAGDGGSSYPGYWFAVFYGRLGFMMGTDLYSGFAGTVPQGILDVADGEWHHVAVTIDRQNNANSALFVDGDLGLNLYPEAVVGSTSNNDPLLIGAAPVTFPSVLAGPFVGEIDEVEIFNRALSAEEIGAIFLAGSWGKCKPTPPTPIQLIQQLIADVIALNLHQGIENSLDTKLDAALHALDDFNQNNDGAVVNTLQA